MARPLGAGRGGECRAEREECDHDPRRRNRSHRVPRLMKGRVVALLIVLGARGAPLHAQEEPHLSLGATFAGVEHVTHESGRRRSIDGMATGGEAMARVGLFAFSASY